MLRPYQLDSLNASKDKYGFGRNRQLLVLPTGMGKTVVFANVREHHGFTKRVMVLVHRDELATQAAEKLQVWNPTLRVGVEMGERRCDRRDDIVVASVQTIGRAGTSRLAQFIPDDFDAVICDEAHHSIASTYMRVIIDHFGFTGDLSTPRLLLGVTATPNRGDGEGLAKVYDEIVFNYPMLQAIREGWLSDVRGFRLKTGVSLDGVPVRSGDFATGELESAVNTDARNDLIVRTWLEKAGERQTIAFTVDIAHAQCLAAAFKRYGVACEALWGVDPDRKEKLEAHKRGGLRLLTNCGVLTEGYDDWRVTCIVMARPTKSQLLFVQMAGRGTRIPNFPDGISLIEARQRGLPIEKEDCMIMDVTDNCTRHSLVTLSTIFGLGPLLDTKGKKITDVISKIEAAQNLHPNADLSKLDDIDKLEGYLQEVDLFKVHFDKTVTENSLLQWHITPNKNFALLLPNDERVVVFQNLLDRWTITGTVNGNKFEDRRFETAGDAIKAADSYVSMFGRDLLTLLHRKIFSDNYAKRQVERHKDVPTECQLIALRRVTRLWPNKPNFETITKGDASLLLNKIYSDLRAKQQVKRIK
jgi:ATP-dependent helicase IRC3